mmetsp:Transcript_47672/g.89217  ORF Transcript_47672/g.89217 Transcript_47672/m.89217 type:complete len:365 (-) Transcript_47672:224-1318(-)
MSVSDGSFSEIETVDRDPFAQFIEKMELGGLSQLGPQIRDKDGKNLLIETAKSGKFNFDFVISMVDGIMDSDASSAAFDVSRKVMKHLQGSAENVLYMRTQVESIASCMIEASEHLSCQDMELLQEAMEDVARYSSRLSERSLDVKAELTEDEQSLIDARKHHKKKEEDARWKSKAYTKAGQASMVVAGGTACATIPAAFFVGSSYASISVVGNTFAVGVVAVCPYTLLFGIGGTVVCGIFATVLRHKANSHQQRAEAASEMAHMTRGMVDVAGNIGRMWDAVSHCATELGDGLKDLKTVNPKRQLRFRQLMENLAKSLRILMEALDEYLVWLSLCKYFPPNYPLADKIGAKRYRAMRAALMDA